MQEITREIGLDAALRNIGTGNGDDSPERSEEEKDSKDAQMIELK